MNKNKELTLRLIHRIFQTCCIQAFKQKLRHIYIVKVVYFVHSTMSEERKLRQFST